MTTESPGAASSGAASSATTTADLPNDLPNGLTIFAGERRARFEVSEEIYDLEVIQGAAYLFLDRCFVWMDRLADRRVLVVLRARAEVPAEALEELAGEFANELLNQALRKRIGDSNSRIREFIMAKAFFSVDAPSTIDRLLAELDAEEMKEDPLEIPVPWETEGAGGGGSAGGSAGGTSDDG